MADQTQLKSNLKQKRRPTSLIKYLLQWTK